MHWIHTLPKEQETGKKSPDRIQEDRGGYTDKSPRPHRTDREDRRDQDRRQDQDRRRDRGDN